MQDWRRKYEELRADMEERSLSVAPAQRGSRDSATPGDGASPSALSVVSAQPHGPGADALLEGALMVPKDDRIKHGWLKRFAVCAAGCLVLYEDAAAKGANPLLTLRLECVAAHAVPDAAEPQTDPRCGAPRDVLLARPVTAADIVRAKPGELERIFQVLYYKKGVLGSATGHEDVHADAGSAAADARGRECNGHVFAEVHFNVPASCFHCNTLIFGFLQHAYVCRSPCLHAPCARGVGAPGR